MQKLFALVMAVLVAFGNTLPSIQLVIFTPFSHSEGGRYTQSGLMPRNQLPASYDSSESPKYIDYQEKQRTYYNDPQAAVDQAIGSVSLVTGLDYVLLTELVVDANWAYAPVGISEQGLIVPSEPVLVIAHKDELGWHALMPNTSTAEDYNAWLDQFSAQLISPEDKEYYRQPDLRIKPTSFLTATTGYSLPFSGGWSAAVTQGPNGSYTHNGYWAVDFSLDKSAGYTNTVVAAKAGTVWYVKDVSATGGVSVSIKYANGVIVRHAADEYSWYWHLAAGSVPSNIQPGVHVEAGEVIGFEGMTGPSTGSHLHFQVTASFPAIDNCDATNGCGARESHADQGPWATDTRTVDFADVQYESAWYGCSSHATCSSTPVSQNYLDPSNGIILYWDANYQGAAWKKASKFGGDVPRWLNDQVSSIRIPDGWWTKLYQDSGQQGNSRELESSLANLSSVNFSDVSTSLQVAPAVRQIKFVENRWPLPWKYQIGSDDSRIVRAILDGQPLFQKPTCTWGTKQLTPGTHTLQFWYQARGNDLPSISIQAWPFLKVACAADDGEDPHGTPVPVSDNGLFISDVTIPDGTVVYAGQALAKTWRVRNTGQTTWGAGYQLVFLSGEQMNAASPLSIPSATPNATADLSINLTAPSASGEHVGYWQLRNPQGTYFGPRLFVKIYVQSSTNHITVLTTDPSSPANTNKVTIHAKVDGFANFRAMRIKVDGNVVREIGAPEVYHDWNTNGYAAGEHSIVVEAADWSDTSWNHPERKGIIYTLQGTTTPVNHQPYPPLPNSPYDWYVYYSGSTATLCAQAQGDPDGDAIASYYFEIHDSGQNWNSGWTGSNCVTTSNLAAYTYQWHVKVQDSRGAISDWSPDFHFTIVNQNLTITQFSLTPLDPNSENVRLMACVSGQGGVGITIRFLVNSATNGTDSGYWRNVGELGVPCFTINDAPVWHTLEDNTLSGDGQHLVRVEAHGAATGWNGAVSQDQVITLPHRRPSDSRLQAPIPASQNNREAILLNTRSVSFKWEKSDRATSYRLSIGLNPSPKDDANPVFRQTYASSITQTVVTLGQDYPVLYWQIEALNDAGSNASTDQLFGIDRVTPTCSIEPLPSVSYENNFQVRWTGSDALSGIRSYNIQYKDSRSNQWSDWLTAVPAAKIYDLFIGQAGHTYSFRCQALDNAGNLGDYPGIANPSITIDPSSRPPEVWWNLGYASKRNLTIQNNMPAMALPANYPVNVKFTSGTTPSAAEIYNLSQSAIKCDDLRIVLNNTTDLNRYVRKCTPDEIDLWFRTQVGISAGSTYTAYQMYLGNPAASNPPADAGQIWYPYRESDTTNLYLFQEGSGSTAYDYSGHGRNCTINPTVNWSTGKWGTGLRFSRANNGNTVSLTCGSPYPISAFTAEFWWKSVVNNNNIDGRLAGQLGPSGQLSWLVSVESDRLKFERWCNGGSDQARGNINLRQSPYYGQWTYLAVTFNGGNQVKFYVNGNLDNAVTLGGNCSATYNIPLEIGSVEGGGQGEYSIGAFRLSNAVKTNFPYGSLASITNEPSTAAGSPFAPPAAGAPDLAVIDVTTYANPGTGTLVQAVVRNQGGRSTQNGFYTDLYMNHLPTGAGDYTGSVRLWINDPVAAGATVTLTTVITDLTSVLGFSARPISAGSEVSGMLYAQVDSTGALSETTKTNNIYSQGTEVCVASADAYESDDTYASARLISIGQTQAHNFSGLGDHDWIKFAATAGQTYLITTSNLGQAADTYLYVYGTDGMTLLASNDDYSGSLASQIEWRAPSSGTYYVLVQHWNPNVGGCGTSYIVAVSRLHLVYLPILLRGYTAAVTVQAAFTASPTYGKVPLNVQFTDQSIGSISAWLWDFGDGSTSSNQNPSHIYTSAGVYTVSLQVMSPSGNSTLIKPGYLTATALIVAWTYTGNLNAARHGQTATLLPNGKVLVTGGYSNGGFTKSAELYDPTTGQWTYTGNLNVFHHHHTATLLPNGKILVVGGHDGSSPVVSAELYDPSTGLWSLTGSLTTARWMHTATLLQDGKVLVTGGASNNFTTSYSSSELYDPATGQWTVTGDLNQARAYHTATRLSDGRVLVTGGCNANSCMNVLNSAEVYDPSSGQWTTTGALNTNRSAHTATQLLDGRVLVVGGCNGSGCITRLASAEIYNPSTGQWVTTTTPTIARSQHITAILSDGTVLVAGGAGNGDVALAGAELFDGNTGQWSTTVSLNTARLFNTGTLLPDGAVMVAGGCASSCSTRTSSVELFTR